MRRGAHPPESDRRVSGGHPRGRAALCPRAEGFIRNPEIDDPPGTHLLPEHPAFELGGTRDAFRGRRGYGKTRAERLGVRVRGFSGRGKTAALIPCESPAK